MNRHFDDEVVPVVLWSASFGRANYHSEAYPAVVSSRRGAVRLDCADDYQFEAEPDDRGVVHILIAYTDGRPPVEISGPGPFKLVDS